MKGQLPRNRFVLVATASYAVLAMIWIFLSDQLLSAFTDLNSVLWLSTAKGVLFVITTTVLFFYALRAVPSHEPQKRCAFWETLSAGNVQGKRPYWLMYLFALAITLSMLWVRNSMAVPFGNRPLLILFMFPIVISALLGGAGPGLLSTAVAAIGVDYWAIPPVYSLRISAGHDLLQWFFLVVNGVAVSSLSEWLLKALKSTEMNRRLLETIVSGSSNAVFIKDVQGQYLLANEATARFLGTTVNQIIGYGDHFFFPEATALQLKAVDRAIMGKKTIQTHEEQLTMPDGRALTFLVTKGPVLDALGSVVGLFGIAQDITGSIEAAEEIRRLNVTLERRVEERTAELSAANRELENQSYAIAHNLRAPLRAMHGFSQALLDDFGDQVQDGMRGYLEQIQQGARQMGVLIDALLELSRSTHAEIQRTQVDISALAEMVRHESMLQEPARTVIWQIEPGLSVWGDENLIEVVMRNLLGNALKFTAGVDAALIRVYADEVDGIRRICISDNGTGFDMRHNNLLFQPFQRLHRQEEFSGAGIGLALVQQIVQRHGGSVQATGELGKGAVFCFSLPE